MRGSDLDFMAVFKQVEIFKDTQIYSDVNKIHFKMEMKDTQPGFTKLHLVHSYDPGIFTNCDEIGSAFYFSNLSFKQRFSTETLSTIHGPCISDKKGVYEVAYCLHSKLSNQWITRSNNSWPRYDVKQDIVKHGVLFVPVGIKGSTQEELEWRISFPLAKHFLFIHLHIHNYYIIHF